MADESQACEPSASPGDQTLNEYQSGLLGQATRGQSAITEAIQYVLDALATAYTNSVAHRKAQTDSIAKYLKAFIGQYQGEIDAQLAAVLYDIENALQSSAVVSNHMIQSLVNEVHAASPNLLLALPDNFPPAKQVSPPYVVPHGLGSVPPRQVSPSTLPSIPPMRPDLPPVAPSTAPPPFSRPTPAPTLPPPTMPPATPQGQSPYAPVNPPTEPATRPPEGGIVSPPSVAPEIPSDTAQAEAFAQAELLSNQIYSETLVTYDAGGQVIPSPHGPHVEVMREEFERNGDGPKVQVAGQEAERPDDNTGQGECLNWCDEANALYDSMVDFGRKLLGGNGPTWTPGFSALELAEWVKWPHVTGSPLDNLTQVIGELLKAEWFNDHFSQYMHAIGNAFPQRTADIVCLMTVKSFVHSASAFSANGSLSAGVGRHVGMGPPTMSGQLFGIDAGQDISTGRTGTISVSIALFIVPLEPLIDQLIERAVPINPLGSGDAIDLWIRGLISERHAECIVTTNGDVWCEWKRLYDTQRQRLSASETIEASRRNKWSDAKLNNELHELGYATKASRDATIQLYDKLPSLSDNLHWLTRNVFDADYVRDYKLLDGFEDRFWVSFGDNLRAIGVLKEYAALHYAAHWVNPGVSELATMVQRLRPGYVRKDLEFTRDDFMRVLAEQDVAPYFREKLYWTSFNVVSYRQMLNLVDTGQATPDEVTIAFLNAGFEQEWADRLTRMEFALEARKHAQEIQGWTPSVIKRAYIDGHLPHDEVITRMVALRYTVDDATTLMTVADMEERNRITREYDVKADRESFAVAEAAYKNGFVDHESTIFTLDALGVSKAAQFNLMANWDFEKSMSDRKAAIGAIRKGWESGHIPDGVAAALLTQTGLTQSFIAGTLANWKAEERVDAKIINAKEVLQLMSEGMLSAMEAESRLVSMGWDISDATLLVGESSDKLRAAEQKQRSTQAAGVTRSAKAASALIIQAENAKKAAVAELKRLTPVASLKKWLKIGVIDEVAFRHRMTELQYTPQVIDNYIEEICQGKGAACVADKSAETPTSASGGNSGPAAT